MKRINYDKEKVVLNSLDGRDQSININVNKIQTMGVLQVIFQLII